MCLHVYAATLPTKKAGVKKRWALLLGALPLNSSDYTERTAESSRPAMEDSMAWSPILYRRTTITPKSREVTAVRT